MHMPNGAVRGLHKAVALEASIATPKHSKRRHSTACTKYTSLQKSGWHNLPDLVSAAAAAAASSSHSS